MAAVELFAAAAPPDGWLEDFERDGFAAFPAAMSAAGSEGLAREFLSRESLVSYLQQSAGDREAEWRAALKPGADPGDGGGPHMGSGGNLNAEASPCDGPYTDQLLDAPFVRSLLSGAMGPHYHLTTPPHGTVRSQGAWALSLHQDHIAELAGQGKYGEPNEHVEAERACVRVQMLAYPSGFSAEDGGL